MLRAQRSRPHFSHSPTSVGTALTEGREIRDFDGKPHVLEHAIHVDYAFLRGYRADRLGNVQFRGGSQNFNPSVASWQAASAISAPVLCPNHQFVLSSPRRPRVVRSASQAWQPRCTSCRRFRPGRGCFCTRTPRPPARSRLLIVAGLLKPPSQALPVWCPRRTRGGP